MAINNFAFQKISSYLANEIYHIPMYQRGYSWGEDQLEDFWMDLFSLVENDQSEMHFLGQIVVHNNKDENKKYIIDGQQRTTTAVILFDVFREIFSEIEKKFNNNDAGYENTDITAKYIGRVSETRQDQRIYLGRTNEDFFREYIQKEGNKELKDSEIKKLNPSNQSIISAKKYFKDKLLVIINDVESGKDKYNKIKEIYDVFKDQFTIMYVETDDINEAYIIFETLNARGKELETSDLLKNHILRSATNNINKAEDDWYKMLDNLDSSDPTKFIRHYWNAIYSFTREKDLYKSIRKNISEDKVGSLLKDLIQLSEVYAALESPDTNKYYEDTLLNDRLVEMKNLRATSYYPIIIAIEKLKFNENDINNILRAIETLIVRNFVVGGKVANKYEIEFAKIALKISRKKLVETDDIIKTIKDLTLGDEEFLDDFKIFTSKATNTIRYLLRKLNNHSNSETRIINDNKSVHIEHILPKKPKENSWNHFNEDEHDGYLWRLGNLTLLGQEYNRKATNKEFEEKKKVYEKSAISMSKELAYISEWTKKDIEDRQVKFANLAPKIWDK